ncbi:MAG: chemotaxis-specific protein-glutamate methyltransferase CheB [Spirochaetales bacterium]|nr:chemotaxis-specific protein-glutamate methyltransferase CheB [Spirochaetales bacterium]
MTGDTTTLKNIKIRVLIIHSLVEGRNLLKQSLTDCSDIEVVGTAPSGSIGLMKARDLKPDIIILDVEIPDIKASVFTKEILSIFPELGIILITSHEPKKIIINETITSLQNGAFDFIRRPYDMDETREWAVLQRRLLPKIRIFSIRRYSRMARIAAGKTEDFRNHTSIARNEERLSSSITSFKNYEKYDLVAIGVSTGGPEALSIILPALPSDFPIPIVIVLHMPQFFTQTMADELNKKSKLSVKEAQEGEILQAGNVYLARGGKHLILIGADPHAFMLHLDDGPEVNGCKPSVDVFFTSVIDAVKNKVIGIILTGMGEDGVKGIAGLKAKGAKTIAQDADTSIVWGMPGAAVREGVIDEVLPLHVIADRLKEITGCV